MVIRKGWNDGKSWKILFGYCHIYTISINMKVKWFQCDLDLKFHETTIFRERIDQASRIWSLILKTCVSHQLHRWQLHLKLFLETIEDRNIHKLKVVNLDVGMKKSGKCQGRKAGA